MFARIGYNLLQVFVVLAFAPLVEGVASRLKEILQSKRGPSIFQPYRDIWKLLHKDEIVSEYSSWIFRAAPYVAFAAPIFAERTYSKARLQSNDRRACQQDGKNRLGIAHAKGGLCGCMIAAHRR